MLLPYLRITYGTGSFTCSKYENLAFFEIFHGSRRGGGFKIEYIKEMKIPFSTLPTLFGMGVAKYDAQRRITEIEGCS
jgi:hypothetical protein